MIPAITLTDPQERQAAKQKWWWGFRPTTTTQAHMISVALLAAGRSL
jgi:hypothetical protein